MMSPFRCQLCGEVYLGAEAPDRCPFCGARSSEIVPAAVWVKYGKLELNEQDAAYLRKALELELGNAAFYKACASKAQTRVSESIFKRLSRQEGEHAELLGDLLGEEGKPPEGVGCPDDDEDKFAEAHRREKRAIIFYLEAADNAQHERIRQVMHAIADVESEHLKISNVYR